MNPLTLRTGSMGVRHGFQRRGGHNPSKTTSAESATGNPGLMGMLTEICSSRKASGELDLILPVLAGLGNAQRQDPEGHPDRRWLAWVAPSIVPHANQLKAAGIDPATVLLIHPHGSDSLRVAEQALRIGTCDAVLIWLDSVDTPVRQRLQRAAEIGGAWSVLFRPMECEVQATSNDDETSVTTRVAQRSSAVPAQLEIDMG